MGDREHHSHAVPGGRGHWWTDRLWSAAADLPVESVPLDAIRELDMDCWFHGRGPTIRVVAEHARRIETADLAHPAILSADGGLMDGGHRLAKAYLLGHATILARRFVRDPEPDWFVPEPGADDLGT